MNLCNLGAFVDVEAVIDSAAQRDQSPVPDQADSDGPTYDDSPCGLIDATISLGIAALDEADFGNPSAFYWCSSWSEEDQSDTFTSVWKVKSGSFAHIVTVASGFRHKYALRAALRNINGTGETAVGARRKVGE